MTDPSDDSGQHPYDFDMPLGEAMMTQRAIRRLSSDPVSDELLKELIALATKAPTAQNHQGWEFIIVRDPVVKAKLAKLNRRVWRLADKPVAWLNRKDEKFVRTHKATKHQVDNFEDIPVLIVCCMSATRHAPSPVVAASSYGSIFPAVQNLLLAARAAGLGANLITMPLTINFAGPPGSTVRPLAGRSARSPVSTSTATEPGSTPTPQTDVARREVGRPYALGSP